MMEEKCPFCGKPGNLSSNVLSYDCGTESRFQYTGNLFTPQEITYALRTSLKRDASCYESELSALKSRLEKLEQVRNATQNLINLFEGRKGFKLNEQIMLDKVYAAIKDYEALESAGKE